MLLKPFAESADFRSVFGPHSRSGTAIFLLGCLFAFQSGCNRIVEAPKTPRGALIVSIDTLRADRIGAYGDAGARTPTLDRLAEDGVRFDAAFSPTPLTLPSHSTILTGLDPDHHGVRHNGIHRLEPHVATIAERFEGAGFATAAFVGSLVIAAQSGLDQGFQHYDDDIATTDDHASAQRRADAVNAAAMRWIESSPDDFFLFVHYYDPHRPYDPPSPFAEAPRSPYDAEISYVDAKLGELVSFLESIGRLDSTLIVVTSDHGESLGEHDELTHGHAIYDATQRIPLIVRGPGLPEEQVVREVVRSSDIVPTVLARMNLPAIEGIDGRDLAPLWTSPRTAEAVESEAHPDLGARLAYVESMATRYDHGWSPLFGLRSDAYLYIDAPIPELYDVGADPAQTANLLESASPAHSDVAAGLREALDRRRSDQVVAEEQELDAVTRAQLHALGYAIPETPREANGIDPKIGRPSLALFHEGDALYQSGRPHDAIPHFEELVRLSPRSGEGWLSLGAARLAAGELDAALEATSEAVRLMPDRSSPRLQRGVIEMALGRPVDAERSFREAIERDPEAPGPRARLIRALVARGRIDDALAADRQIDALGWTHEVWLRRIADFWEAQEQVDAALAAYQRVLAVAPESARDHMHAAIALIRLGRLDEARPHLARAGDVALQPRARAALEASLLEAGYVEEARRMQRDPRMGS